MESKTYEARSKKVAYALLRRAVALNPHRHANVLKWSILFDLKQAGEAAMEAMYSELSHGQAVMNPSFKAWSTPLMAPMNTTEGAVEVSYSTGGIFSIKGKALRVGNGESGGVRSRSNGQGWFTTTDPARHSSSSPRQALEFVSRMGGKWSKEREDVLATDILDLCQSSGNFAAKNCATCAGNSSVQTRHGPAVEWSAKFKEVLLQLEKAGKGVGDTGNSNERALGGTWQLVFTTCTTCDRVIRRAGTTHHSPPPNWALHFIVSVSTLMRDDEDRFHTRVARPHNLRFPTAVLTPRALAVHVSCVCFPDPLSSRL